MVYVDEEIINVFKNTKRNF